MWYHGGGAEEQIKIGKQFGSAESSDVEGSPWKVPLNGPAALKNEKHFTVLSFFFSLQMREQDKWDRNQD